MKLGLSTWSLLGLDLPGAVKTIGDARIGYIELWGEFPHAYPGSADVAALKDVLSSYAMTVTAHAPFTDLNPASPEPLVRGAVEKVLQSFVDMCAKLGVVMVTVHPGSVHNRALVEGSASASVATLRKVVEAADGRLSVNVENQAAGTSPYHYPLATTADSLEALLVELGDAKCTLDTGHAHASGLNPLGMAERLGGRVAEVHLSDNSGKADEHLIPGRGNAPLDRLMGRVSQTDALVCLELNPHVYDSDQVIAGFEEAKGRYS
jgi:sugar phosphate isomerase/epimerase